jgi:hypothetical protein
MSPERLPAMQPSTENPICPEHATSMIAYEFEQWEVNQLVQGFRCANLSCRIVYIEGDREGFYTWQPNGELTPYP